MKVEVVRPGRLHGRRDRRPQLPRGMIQGMEMRGGAQVITAEVPLAEMFGYATDLRSLTQGRAAFTMEFAHYDEVPNNVAEAIIKEPRTAA
ncbi:MAG: hypothetical protein MPW14_05020 [Candidatus Manganitrophus sp.]|nr:MAG: hypothetical protein MPW14_05020 [Candidatus Manganitrophus sp.]